MPATKSTEGSSGCSRRSSSMVDAGLLLVAVVEVHVDHLQARVHDGGVELEGTPERALGQHVVLGPAVALGVEHVAAAEGGVGAGELGVLADGLVDHLDRGLEVVLVVGPLQVAEQEVAAAQVELVGLGAVGEGLLDLPALGRGELQLDPGEEALGQHVLHRDEVGGRECRSCRSRAISPVAVETSWAVTRSRSAAWMKLPRRTAETASSSPTCRGSTFWPT